MKTIVIALGGNAITRPGQRGTTEEQFANVDTTARQIAKVARAGLRIVLTHGNGPQAGALLIQQEEAEALVPGQTLAACGAMTQGQVGWMIQNRLGFHLSQARLDTPVCSIVTQVLVDESDPDFRDPSKPVGPFYNASQAMALANMKRYVMKEVRPGCPEGWRRVVPSPEPRSIVEEKLIRALLAEGAIVIASGGGGIPVARSRDGSLHGVNAVIDKDKAGFILAQAVCADLLVILTDVEQVALGFGRPGARFADRLTVEQAEKYFAEGQFLRGSMGPKVEACIRFVRWSGKPAIIGPLDKAWEALEGKSGTLFVA